MLRILHFSLLLCLICLVSCSHPSDYQSVWNRVDTLLETRPDSALHILDEISVSTKLSSYDYATYCLLLTAAKDKNYVTHTSDSLINVAVRYFSKKKDLKRKAEAYYYAGRINNDLNNGRAAMDYFLKAKDCADQTKVYWLRGVIKYHLAKLWLYIDRKSNALVLFKEADEDYSLGVDVEDIAYAWNAIGYVYMKMQQTDSAEFHFKKALKIAKENDFRKLICGIETNLGNLYSQTGQYELAIEHSRTGFEYIEKEIPMAPAFFVLGRTFFQMGQLDSSTVYMQKALDGSLYTKSSANRYLAKIYQEKKDYITTVKYLSDYVQCKDSIRIAYDEPRMKELELRYNTEKIEQENERLAQDRKVMLLWIVLLLSGGFLVILCICLYFNRRMLRKERELRAVREEMDDYEQKYVQVEKEKADKESEVGRLKSQILEKEQQQKELQSQNESPLQEEIDQVNQRIENLKDDILHLSKKGAYLMELLLKGSKIQDRIGDASLAKIEKRMTVELWRGIQDEINRLDPTFLKNLQKNASSLKERDKQLCCLLKLNVPLDQIAALMQVDKRSISRYKSDIVRNNFNRTDRILLDTLLRQL